MRRATLTITMAAFFVTTQLQAAESYTSLSRAVVLATVSPDLLGTTKIDPRPFAKCFRASTAGASILLLLIVHRSQDSRLCRGA